MKIIRLIVTTLAVMFGSLAHASTELDRVWDSTLIVFPHSPSSTSTWGNSLRYALDRYKPTEKLPAVVFMHGCSGLWMSSTQVTKMIRSFAEAGFVVFAPDSLARPGQSAYCQLRGDGSLLTNLDKSSIPRRIEEAKATFERIKQFDWIDADNIFLAGHSMGGNTVVRYPYPDFRAMASFGWNCGRRRVAWFLDGFEASPSVPIMTLYGFRDEHLARHQPGVSCGDESEMKGKTHRVSVTFNEAGHDLSADPRALPMAIDFFRRYATRPIMPIIQ